MSETVTITPFVGVRIDFPGWGQIVDSLKQPEGGAFAPVFTQWAAIYRGDMRERFVTNSRGGGDWPDLAESTKMARERRPLSRLHQDFVSSLMPLDEYKGLRNKAYKKVVRARANRRAKERTVRGFAAHHGEGQMAILRDTGTLFAGLTPAFQHLPGQYENRIPYGIEVGYGGEGMERGNSRMTVAQVAKFHQEGIPSKRGRIVRKTIVEPSDRALQIMVKVAEARLSKLMGV